MSTSRSRGLDGLGHRPGADRGPGRRRPGPARTICRRRSSAAPTPLTAAGPGARRARRNRSRAGPDPALGRLHRLNARIYETDDASTPSATGVDTTAEQACAAGHGVCQDFAHMLHRRRPPARHPGPLRLRPSLPPRRRARAGGGACLGRGLGRRSRLGRLRSDQRHLRRRRLCPRRLRPRLSRRRAGRRRTFGWRRRATDGRGRGQRDAARSRSPSRRAEGTRRE